MSGSSAEIRIGALIGYTTILVNVVLGLIYTPWIIASIGQANYGLYTLAVSLISLFTLDFGLSIATQRFVAKYLAEGDQGGANNALGVIYRLYLLFTAVLFLALLSVYFFLDRLYSGLTPDELSSFRVVYLVVAAFSVLSFPFITLNGILAAHEKFTALSMCNLIQKLLTVVLVFLALFSGLGLYALVAINASVGLFMIGVKLVIVQQRTSTRVSWLFKDRAVRREILVFGGRTTVIAVSQRLVMNATPSVLGSVSGSVAVAVFGIAAVLEGYLYMVASTLSGLFLPRVSKLLALDKLSSNLSPLMVEWVGCN